MRKISALVVTVGLLASLTACATEAGPGAAGCPSTGDAASVVSVSGAFGKKPDVTVPTPIATTKTEVATITAGDGEKVVDGTPVSIDFTLFDGTTGQELENSGYNGTTPNPITVGGSTLGPLADGLKCSTVGSRVVVTMKASELNASAQGSAPTTKNDEPDASYVAVVDIRKAYLPKADGHLVPGANGLPAVVTAPNGAPGISVPDAAAPTSEVTHLVRQGTGHTLTSKDTAVIQFTAVTWETPATVASSTWTNGGSATSVRLDDDQIPAEITKALIGQTVGSQVMVVIPADQAKGIAQTYVYVFDVLGVL